MDEMRNKLINFKVTEYEYKDIRKLVKEIKIETGKPAADAILSALRYYINDIKRLGIGGPL